MLTRTFLVTTECSTDNHADVILEALTDTFRKEQLCSFPRLSVLCGPSSVSGKGRGKDPRS